MPVHVDVVKLTCSFCTQPKAALSSQRPPTTRTPHTTASQASTNTKHSSYQTDAPAPHPQTAHTTAGRADRDKQFLLLCRTGWTTCMQHAACSQAPSQPSRKLRHPDNAHSTPCLPTTRMTLAHATQHTDAAACKPQNMPRTD